MYCRNCGKEIDDKAVICVYCGVPTDIRYPQNQDVGGAGICILSFLIPIIGVIYYFVKRKEKPRVAKNALIASLIAWVIYIAFAVF